MKENGDLEIGDVVKSDCRKCNSKTRHQIKGLIVDKRHNPWENERDSWAVVQCQGCLTNSFHLRNEDFEQVFEDFEGELQHSVTDTSFPSVIRNHRPLSATHLLPHLINTIYQQTVKALSQNANVLASIGLRATIEAVCNNLTVSGTNLQKRIDSLFKAGYVSSGDKRRLHAIRFLGNDAAHEIKQPQRTDILIALEIVEHLLNTVFILESRAKGLETVVEDYQEFLKLLEQCARKHKDGNALNLLGILGKQRRLIAISLDVFETQLLQELDADRIPFLLKATPQNDGGKVIHMYQVNPDYFQEDPDEIPF
ncbi:DUF4145 domain-containing protein [Pseudomonas syringae]|uniref:DUF4145 domain-containing protein n=1 Tax=Pseudomonas syringae TaxID=317 RepID=UPI0020BE8976|nr:DUF4145 domain-containing protein [Pseudomonas syringae]MCL6306944.1 DUF4145 domain-containing protein [Pseudomonas syringae]